MTSVHTMFKLYTCGLCEKTHRTPQRDYDHHWVDFVSKATSYNIGLQYLDEHIRPHSAENEHWKALEYNALIHLRFMREWLVFRRQLLYTKNLLTDQLPHEITKLIWSHMDTPSLRPCFNDSAINERQPGTGVAYIYPSSLPLS